jgi:hypothetical protein
MVGGRTPAKPPWSEVIVFLELSSGREPLYRRKPEMLKHCRNANIGVTYPSLRVFKIQNCIFFICKVSINL